MAITATFQANFDQFVSAVKGAEASLAGIKATASSVGTAVVASLASTEIRRFAGDVRTAANEFIGAFAEEEAAVNKLRVALEAQGTDAAMAQYRALAAEFQRTTTFSDDLVVSMTAMMVQVGGVMPDQMDAALTAAANLSAGLGISLEQATMLVAKAFGQGGEQLGRLKAILGDTVPKGADMAAVMDAINAKFGGQAAAQIDTYAGRMQQLNNQMSDFKEKAGEVLVNGLTPLLNAFAAMPESMQTVLVGVVAITTALAPIALSITALTPVVTALATALGVSLTGAFVGLLPFLGVAGLIAIGAYAAIENWKALAKTFMAASSAIGDATQSIRASVGPIIGYAKAIYEGFREWLVGRFESIVESIRSQVAAVTGFFRDMYDKVVGHSYVPDMMRVIAAEFALLATLMVPPAQAATQGVTQAFQTMTDNVIRSGAVFRSEVIGMLSLAQTHAAALEAGSAARTARQAQQSQGGSSAIPPTIVTEGNRAFLEARLASITASYAQYPGRMAGGSGRTGAMDATGWSNMLREQIEFQSLTNALRSSVPFSSGSGGGGVTIDTINVTQPLGTPDAIGRAISEHLTKAVLQGRKVAA